jgi:acyl-CoA reductase-like NAD-dependent aldehyde dehydrogenase
VTGYGETAGAAIAAHPGIDKVSFTGSTETGKKILNASIRNLKRVTLELGGKSPHVIMPDADIDLAARVGARAFCLLTGQTCVAGTRILVHESIHDEFAGPWPTKSRSIDRRPLRGGHHARAGRL